MNIHAASRLSWILPAALHRRVNAMTTARERKRAAKQLTRQSRLHLACGSNLLAGWANVDIDGASEVIKLDLTRSLPVASESIDFVFCEHFIEHISASDAERLLREIRRCLRPGGVIRLSTPDLAVLVTHYRDQKLDTWHDVGWTPQTPCRLLNEGLHSWGHQFVYDQRELETLLGSVGFSAVRRVRWRQSDHRELSGLECRPDHSELIYEATR
jgi:predicted SAM-dependent methyltransferase